jgi:hypothetical protein
MTARAVIASYRVVFAARTLIAIGAQIVSLIDVGIVTPLNSFSFFTILSNLSAVAVLLICAAWVLHEVFDYRYDEVASMPDKSEAACRSRSAARKRYLAENRRRFKATPEHRRILEQFMRAAASGDLDGMTAMLTKDVVFWADGGGNPDKLRRV